MFGDNHVDNLKLAEAGIFTTRELETLHIRACFAVLTFKKKESDAQNVNSTDCTEGLPLKEVSAQ